MSHEFRRFDDIPNGVTFADKFGRTWTKTSVGSARSHEVLVGDLWQDTFDTSRDYYAATEDELEDCDMWDAWPYYRVDGETVTYDALDEVPWNSVKAVTSPSGHAVGIVDGFAVWLTGLRSGQRIPLDAHGPWKSEVGHA